MKKIISVVGARPNFMKVAPLHKAFQKYKADLEHLICHTGQHYDENMSKIFFNDLDLPKPDFYLGIGSASHAVQAAHIMIEFEKVVLEYKPDLVIVVGDVNSTVACSLVATKLGVKIAHVEAGLRSFDRTMPEEINRILTDSIADFLFVTEQSGIENLKHEGISDEKIFFTGNIMIDSLLSYIEKANQATTLTDFNLLPNDYVLVTLHRPSNVDEKQSLSELVDFLNRLSKRRKIIFPIHPRTHVNLEKHSLLDRTNSNLKLTEPVGFIDFLCLMKNAQLVITDSGGIQEETTFLNVPCITIRDSTERPVTVEIGSNYLAGIDLNNVEQIAHSVLDGRVKKRDIPELWDGKTAERIAGILCDKLNCEKNRFVFKN